MMTWCAAQGVGRKTMRAWRRRLGNLGGGSEVRRRRGERAREFWRAAIAEQPGSADRAHGDRHHADDRPDGLGTGRAWSTLAGAWPATCSRLRIGDG